MTRAHALLGRFLADESGATAIEYALIALLVAVPTVAAFTVLGTKISSAVLSVAAGLK